MTTDFQLDDALIYSRYIRNFHNGEGLVYNPGEYFNGLTSPMFTYVSLLVTYFIPDTVLAINLLSGLFFILSIVVYSKLFENQSKILWGAILVSTSPFFYTVFGMETTMFLFMAGLTVYLFTRDSGAYLITAVLLVLTRSEGAFLALPMGFFFFREKRKLPALPYIIISVLILAVHFSFARYYYGHFMPMTGSAKIWQGQSGLWGTRFPIFFWGGFYLKNWFFYNDYHLLLFAAMAVIGFSDVRKNKSGAVFLFWILLVALFYIVLNIPNYHWYNAPFFLALYSLAGAGLNRIWNAEKKSPWSIKYFVYRIMALLFVVILVYGNLKKINYTPGAAQHYKAAGEWLAENTRPEESVALVEIGTVGWYSQNRIIDILGLVNPYNAKLIGERNFSGWLDYYEPDYILVHMPLWAHEASVEELVFSGEYTAVKDFRTGNLQLLKKNDDLPEKQKIQNKWYSDKYLLNSSFKVLDSNSVKFWFDEVKTNRNYIKINGWFFRTDRKGAVLGLMLRQKEGDMIYIPEIIQREDVARHFDDESVISSGFRFIIPPDIQPESGKDIEIWIIDRNTKEAVNTGIKL